MKPFLILISFVVSLNALVTRGQGQTDWPIKLAAPEGKIVIYQPQPTAFTGGAISAEAAVSVTPKGAGSPVFGVTWFDARVATDRDTRMAKIADIKVTRLRFPDSATVDQKKLSDFVGAELTAMQLPISMDELRDSLEGIAQADQGASSLQNDPPNIIFATTPTVLVTLDGPPEMRPMGGSKVMQVVNTPFAILFDPGSKSYYLRTGDDWMSAPDISGPWQAVDRLPDAVQSALPADMAASTPGADSGSVAIVTATDPTELVVTDGEAKFSPLPGNELLYVTNSESDVFLHIASATYYILLSGRWYNAATLDGPWSYVAPKDLPSAFADIPPDSPKGSVLAQVPGTLAADEAVLEASIPQTQEIERNAPVDLQVSYDGDPNFESMEGTTAQYATNTKDSVIKSDGGYYCCKDAVWYQAPKPSGPWIVCAAVPPPIYRIPPSSPVYNVTYVRVYDSTPTTVYVGYTMGYTGCYARGGVVVYGTGYRYAAWRGGDYYARPATWGFAVRYNSYTDSWGFGVRVGRVGAWYGPALGWGGSISPYSGWWGPGGYRDYGGGYYGNNKVTINQNTYKNSYTTNNNYNNSKKVGNVNIGNGSGNGNNNGNGNNIGNGNRPTQPGGGNGNGIGNGNRPSRPGAGNGNESGIGSGNRPGAGGENSGRPGSGSRPPANAERPSRPGLGERPATLPERGGDNIYNRPGNRPIQAPETPVKPSQPIVRPAGKPNDVLADRAGNIYRKDGKEWQTRDKEGWKPAAQPAPKQPSVKQPNAKQPAAKQPSKGKSSDFDRVRPQLERDNANRDQGKAQENRDAQARKPAAKPKAQPVAQSKQQPAKNQQPGSAGGGGRAAAVAAKRRGQ